ncbi:DNA-binding protein HU [Pseudomonas jessenii]|jgi:Bacterial nucleoid DNA-binding protein|uniref:DNA-binding protein HU-beta n=2 Tax=Pseudomonas TaxID=286 RepID=A0A231GP30_PSEJE|nr:MULTISPECIES: HU family DNA-binding protein [Pseudomonas]MBK3443101.1 HU family DNA-binding protein [Pseudomonas lactis]OXR38384.1 DNA-binding protein HU [Pseudomonas jessenii]RDS87442.1 HU family DNA-binding protein [Pseudomonas fluorescens]RTY69776.1 HU family DNA-binding protein [Pseudomonas veronii]WRU64888.1 HU family DNA-binding protein [Pseudomonas veronii]
MNKNDLVEAIASSADLPKSTAGRALEALTTIISTALQSGENVTLVGFGTFAVKARAARDGRNPQTGATIKIAAAKTPSFKAGKSLKDAVN